jgi:hypothetical protein
MVVQILLSFNPVGEFCAPEFMLNNSLSRAGVFALMGERRCKASASPSTLRHVLRNHRMAKKNVPFTLRHVAALG